MGSPLRLTIGSGVDPAAASGWWQAVVAEFEEAEMAMSRFRDTSELTRLNRGAGGGAMARPSVRLRRALLAADRAHRVSDGRFDPRVLADLDRLGYRGAPLDGAGAGRVAAGAARVDADASRRRRGRIVERAGRDGISLARPVDLGGIGKGLALRWATGRLSHAGARAFLLEAGGDLVTRGPDPDGGPWPVGIEDPAGGEDLAVIAVSNLAVATSSIMVNRWLVDGRVAHHLVDPGTGEPANGGLVAVTVAGPDPAWAEVWSKVLFLGGRDAIRAEARGRGLAAWWVRDDGALEMTAAARAVTIWVGAEAA